MMIKWGSNMFILISNGVDFVKLDYNIYLNSPYISSYSIMKLMNTEWPYLIPQSDVLISDNVSKCD